MPPGRTRTGGMVSKRACCSPAHITRWRTSNGLPQRVSREALGGAWNGLACALQHGTAAGECGIGSKGRGGGQVVSCRVPVNRTLLTVPLHSGPNSDHMMLPW